MATEDEVDYSKLSLEDKCLHKNWKARVAGYDDLLKILKKIDDEKSPEWSKYSGMIRKFPLDCNAAALEKSLEVTLCFIENAHCATRIVAEVMSGVVAKCIIASKAQSKVLAANITLMCVEIEKCETVQEELMKGMDMKNPKVVAGCISIMTQCVREFGDKVINLKPLIKKFPPLSEDRDKTVRDETKKLIVELYRWMTSTLKPLLAALKPVVLQELENEFSKVGSEKPKRERYLRSQQARQERIVADDGSGAVEDDEAVAEDDAPAIDPYDLLDPVDILSKLPKDFYEKCDAKKWQDRKEAMETLETLVANPKLEPGDYADLVRKLKHILAKDSNVLVVGLAGKNICGLATGLKKKFSPYASSCLQTIFEKFKEKKTNVVTALRDASDACYFATNLEAIQEDAIAALGGKNPAVKQETLLFLARNFAKTPFKIISDKKIMKPYFTTILANLNESDPNVRDSAAEALGVAMKSIGEKPLQSFLQDIEPIKLQKIKEFCEKAVITAPKVAVVKPQKSASGTKTESSTITIAKKSSAAVGGRKSVAVKKPGTPGSAVRGGGGKVVQTPSVEDLKNVDDEDEKDEPASDASDKPVDIHDQLTPQLLTELCDKNWKTRDDAIGKISEIVRKYKSISPNLGDFPNALSQRLQDSNRNLAANSLVLCQHLGTALGRQGRQFVSLLFPCMLHALSDSKIAQRANVIGCIDAWADNVGLGEFFQGEMIADCLKTGNPFQRADLFNWLHHRLPNMKAVNKDELIACIPYLYTSVEDRNPDVRRGANDAVLPFMIHLGYDAMLRKAGNLKPSSKTVVQGLLDKARPSLPAKPAAPSAATKGKPAAKSASNGSAKPSSASSSGESVTSACNGGGKSKIARAQPTSRTKITSPTSKKNAEECSGGPNLISNMLKQQRISDENKLKVLRWNFTSPREEFIELLKDQMCAAGLGKNLVANMFHADFKMHLKAIDTLHEELNYGLDGTMANLDLILKWFTIRFFDTNPSVLLRSLDYIQLVISSLGMQGYIMPDIEANSFLPYVLLKIGDPKDAVRNLVHKIVYDYCSVYLPTKVFIFVLDGLKSKNARQRAECLEEMSNMISEMGMEILMPNPSVILKEIAKQISDRDNSVRNAALNAVVQVYFREGDKVYRMIGILADKDQSLLEERIKRAQKSRPNTQNRHSLTNQTLIINAGPSASSNNSLGLQLNSSQNSESEMDIMITPEETTPEQMPMEHIYNTAHVAPPTRTFVLPEKYRVDFEAIDNMFGAEDNVPIPELKLYDTNTDYLKYESPVALPIRRFFQPNLPVMVEQTNFSPRATQSIDLVVSQVSSLDLRLSMESLVQLDALITDPDVSNVHEIMTTRIDNLLSMVALQFRRLQPHLGGSNEEKHSDINKFLRCSLATVSSIYKNSNLAIRASKEIIQELIYHLLSLITEPKLAVLQDQSAIVKNINVLVVRIIEKSDPNATICALIRLMNESLMIGGSSSRIMDLVMKCLWKLLKQMGVWAENGNYEWNLEAILSEFHDFMKSHPFNSFVGRDNTPLKTIKTILHSLVSHVGPKRIQDQLNKMPELKSVEAGIYLQKLIHRESLKKKERLN